jgi:primosomal protein N' (replication factor Y) (superfamily II helicase)
MKETLAKTAVPMTSSTPIARVVLDVPLARSFDFLAPGLDATSIGRLVIVPFGRGAIRGGGTETVGLIVDVVETTEVPIVKLKSISALQKNVPAFTATDLALFRFCARYYHHPLGQVALSAIPPTLRAAKLFTPRAQHSYAITDAGRAYLATLNPRITVTRQMLALLNECESIAEAQLKQQFVRAAVALRALAEKKFIAIVEAEVANTSAHKTDVVFAPSHALNAEQARALAAIEGKLDSFAPILLNGITGSGKTEVYLHAIYRALTKQKQALVLVPEINLSPAFARAVAARFPHSEVAVLHSAMADGARTDAWLAAQSGRADIVIGTRLAVFTPIPRLGLIIVDEEHDASYKQQEGFRYSARDVAVFRAQAAICPVVLGSATPSLETLHNVERERFTQINLTERAAASAALPHVEFIDTNIERSKDGLTQSLIRAIDETVKRGEQALIFINRRGYAPALVCAQCGWMPACGRCTAKLVFHKGDARLRCHHCGFQSRIPAKCSDCGSHELAAAGEGTERVESSLQTALPSLRMARVDRDSTRKRGSAEKIFEQAAKGELDVLVGTQMLSKGHDFPNITLVGVINSDGAIFSADFRAAERLAAQMMQVAGRAGRAQLAGRVLIQTRFPGHPVYQAIAAQNYAQFSAIALKEREASHLPPYSFLAMLRAESRNSQMLADFMAGAAKLAGEFNTSKNDEVQIWDPIPPTLARKAGFERRQLMVQARSRKALQQFLSGWLPLVGEYQAIEKLRNLKWIIDVDPQDV